jgi:hypothetical protein
MRNHLFALALSSMLLPVFAAAAEAVSEDEAQGLGVDAYLYFYPLVTMDITRRQLTNQGPTPGGSVDR